MPSNQADTPQLTIVSSSANEQVKTFDSVNVIDFLRAITASLDVEHVLGTLNRFLHDLVHHNGWEYTRQEGQLLYQGGTEDRHRIEYDLSLAGESLGALVLMRGRRFSSSEQMRIESLLGLAAPALRNALQHQSVVGQLERDPLTRLGNRLALFREGERWLANCIRHACGLALMVIDLDGFKAINDRFGHLEGDRLLVAVADALRSATRASDLCVRIGGDEFVVLLPGACLTAGEECAERIRHEIQKRSIVTLDGTHIHVHATVGVSAYREGVDLTGLYQEADNALYQAKRAGRNRVCVAQAAAR